MVNKRVHIAWAVIKVYIPNYAVNNHGVNMVTNDTITI